MLFCRCRSAGEHKLLLVELVYDYVSWRETLLDFCCSYLVGAHLTIIQDYNLENVWHKTVVVLRQFQWVSLLTFWCSGVPTGVYRASLLARLTSGSVQGTSDAVLLRLCSAGACPGCLVGFGDAARLGHMQSTCLAPQVELSFLLMSTLVSAVKLYEIYCVDFQ